jgi:CheY-like chemotaxis protein
MSTADMLPTWATRWSRRLGRGGAAAAEGGLQPDLLVTDHLMPGMTGTDLAREVRARGGPACRC